MREFVYKSKLKMIGQIHSPDTAHVGRALVPIEEESRVGQSGWSGVRKMLYHAGIRTPAHTQQLHRLLYPRH
jgi:hypothetical protein